MLYKEERVEIDGIEVITRKRLGDVDLSERVVAKLHKLAMINHLNEEAFLHELLANYENDIKQ